MDEAAVRRILCEFLGVSADATEAEIDDAFSKKAKEWHPDRVNHNRELAALAEQRIKLINQAHDCLKNRQQFEMHGEKLAKQLSNDASLAAGGPKTSAKANPQHAQTNSSKDRTEGPKAQSQQSNTKTAGSTQSGGPTNDRAKPESQSKQTAKPARKPPPENRKIIIGIVVVLLAMWALSELGVFKENHQSYSSSSSPGVVPRPSEAPGAPVQVPQHTDFRMPPDTSIGAPPN